ncbi:MAG TPA: hypothetical protein VNB23_06120 [Ramlibacter sp.]|nr:hypothetical protein [Ramlibacter sp.]
MKTITITLVTLAALAGCATTAALPQGMRAGEFVQYSCEGGKKMAARVAPDGSTVRVRFEGGYELDRKDAGVYEGDGWKLTTAGATAELAHGGKVVAKGCKPA